MPCATRSIPSSGTADVEKTGRERAVQTVGHVVLEVRHEERRGGDVARVEAHDVGPLPAGIEQQGDDNALVLVLARRNEERLAHVAVRTERMPRDRAAV